MWPRDWSSGVCSSDLRSWMDCSACRDGRKGVNEQELSKKRAFFAVDARADCFYSSRRNPCEGSPVWATSRKSLMTERSKGHERRQAGTRPKAVAGTGSRGIEDGAERLQTGVLVDVYRDVGLAVADRSRLARQHHSPGRQKTQRH